MREIKFRAWWKDAKLMEEVVTLRDGEVSILVPLKPNSFGQKYEHQTLEEGQYELMQFTGLKDKNGKEIYEGDVVRFKERPYYVSFNDGCFGLTIETAPHLHMQLKALGGRGDTIDYEVIGNIYENPELLNV